ncbi:MAG: WecB/TagA/CpsF family glycosyltransferase [Alphaproteobacteria bacterium]
MKPKQSINDVKHVLVGGIKTACLSRADLTDLMVEDCRSRRESNYNPALIFDSNGHGLSLAASNKAFKTNLHKADIIHADGGIIVTAANKMTDGNIGDRSSTTDYFHDAAKAAVANNLTFYLLGATEEVNHKCYNILKEQYSELKIIGRRNGYFTKEQEDEVCADISSLKPDIVWVGLGKPKEQDFCVRNKHKIDAGWLITCGGCYNYVTGDYPRAPLWMQRSNLEWLHRMVTNPRQLFWRYLTTNPHALFLIVTKTKKDLLN